MRPGRRLSGQASFYRGGVTPLTILVVQEELVAIEQGPEQVLERTGVVGLLDAGLQLGKDLLVFLRRSRAVQGCQEQIVHGVLALLELQGLLDGTGFLADRLVDVAAI